MARITVEDCLAIVPNRFSLVLVAAERAKQLLNGAEVLLEGDNNNKEVVSALREIAAGEFTIDQSAVLAEDRWMPIDRQAATLEAENLDLPPEADDLPPEADDLPPEPTIDDTQDTEAIEATA